MLSLASILLWEFIFTSFDRFNSILNVENCYIIFGVYGSHTFIDSSP